MAIRTGEWLVACWLTGGCLLLAAGGGNLSLRGKALAAPRGAARQESPRPPVMPMDPPGSMVAFELGALVQQIAHGQNHAAWQMLREADRLAQGGDAAAGRERYRELLDRHPDHAAAAPAREALHRLEAQMLLGAGEAPAGLSVTGEVCWQALASTDPAKRLQWLDEAFAAYCAAVDENQPQQARVYEQVIRQLSPETATQLHRLKPRTVHAVVRIKFIEVIYTRHMSGQQSIAFGLAVKGR